MSHPAASRTIKIVSKGEYSNHSPGCCGGGRSSVTSRSTLMFIASAVRAVSGPGADHMAITTETDTRATDTTIDCHKKIVSENGMTPVMGRRDLGKLPAFACSCAADEERPIAQVAPSPRYAAAAAAR